LILLVGFQLSQTEFLSLSQTHRRDVSADGDEFRRHGYRSTHPKMFLNLQKLLEALQVSF